MLNLYYDMHGKILSISRRPLPEYSDQNLIQISREQALPFLDGTQSYNNFIVVDEQLSSRAEYEAMDHVEKMPVVEIKPSDSSAPLLVFKTCIKKAREINTDIFITEKNNPLKIIDVLAADEQQLEIEFDSAVSSFYVYGNDKTSLGYFVNGS